MAPCGPSPLTKRLATTLVSHRASAEGVEGVHPFNRVFPGHSRGIQTLWNKVRRHLKLEADPHCVVHITCASRLLQAGADLEYVRRWLGHEHIQMTQRYAHLPPTSLDRLAVMLERPMEQKPQHLGVVQSGASHGGGQG